MKTLVVKIAWLALCGAVLTLTLAKFDGRPNSDIEEFLIFSMLALSFPAGVVFAAAISGLYWVMGRMFGVTFSTGYMDLVLEWAGFVVFGYIQWFVLLPRLWKTVWRRSSVDS
jgi:hypothetical protein